VIWLGPPHDPPLDPSGSDARSKLRNELLHPEYHQQNVVQQIMDWLERQVNDGLNRASQASPLSTLATMVVFLGLVAVLVWLVSQARRTAHQRGEKHAVLTAEVVSAAELRARAEAALEAGRFEEAVVEGFRALAVRQVERGRLSDTPGATAHEVASILAAEYPATGDRVRAGALLFDEVLYGDRPATRAQAESVLAIDDDLSVRR
jgi:cytoskeletal protein RodZ